MTDIKEKVTGGVDEVRERAPLIDHLIRMVKHYGNVNGNRQAGAVTYFAFLSFFPILALAFFVVGIVARVYSGAERDLITALDSVIPKMIGNEQGQISLDQIQTFSGVAAVVGVAGVLFAGLNWLSALRDALEEMFELPKFVQPGFVSGKLRDLVSLGSIGLVLFVSVGVSGALTGATEYLLGLVGLSDDLSLLVKGLAFVVGLLANAVLFFALFRLLANPPTPKPSLRRAALLGAILFEGLKQLAFLVLGSTEGKPAFQAFGIALTLLVWIYYFSRIVLYAAAFAHTSPEARAMRQDGPAQVQGPGLPSLVELGEAGGLRQPAKKREWVAPFAGGAGAMLGLIAVMKKKSS
ncbi:inner membrane protein YhjD [Nocardioides salsibiostraticola]